jgi:hypothetical protein
MHNPMGAMMKLTVEEKGRWVHAACGEGIRALCLTLIAAYRPLVKSAAVHFGKRPQIVGVLSEDEKKFVRFRGPFLDQLNGSRCGDRGGGCPRGTRLKSREELDGRQCDSHLQFCVDISDQSVRLHR